MLTGDLYTLLRVYRYTRSPRPVALAALDGHQAILTALERRDSAGAECAMRTNLQNARRYVDDKLADEGSASTMEMPRRRTARLS